VTSRASDRLLPGKVPWDVVAECLRSELPPEVVLGPAAGEDAALVRIGGELWAVASDPISFTATDAGRLAVQVNANDVAVRGAVPRFFTAVVLVAPTEATEARVREIMDQINEACAELEIALIGGHTEITPGLPHSMVVGTMLGPVTGRPITSGGLRPGDWVGMSKWAGLEGTAILLADLGDRLRAVHGEDAFRSRHEIYPREWLSVVPEAAIAAANDTVSALHDVTEGGLGEALYELGRASGTVVELDREKVPILAETRMICTDLTIDPLGLIGSGALLVGCADEGRLALEQAYEKAGVPFAWIGRASTAETAAVLEPPRFERDEILKAWLLEGLEAVIFDMDGTIVDSDYHWPSIRERLGVGHHSIIDELNGLPEPERSEKWNDLDQIERRATMEARLKPGVPELLDLLAEHDLKTALVTNNSESNTRWLLDRYDLGFELVMSRDSGLWKPSGAPLAEAMIRLGVESAHTLAVGDSGYDIRAAREAGCGHVCIVHGACLEDEVDLRFAEIPALTRYLRIVL
jgi:HAD superfamily hydrolase (TIGR01509 family)